MQPIVQTLNVVPVENRRQPVGVAVAVSLLTLALGFGIAYAAPKPSFVPVVGLLLPELPRISTRYCRVDTGCRSAHLAYSRKSQYAKV